MSNSMRKSHSFVSHHNHEGDDDEVHGGYSTCIGHINGAAGAGAACAVVERQRCKFRHENERLPRTTVSSHSTLLSLFPHAHTSDVRCRMHTHRPRHHPIRRRDGGTWIRCRVHCPPRSGDLSHTREGQFSSAVDGQVSLSSCCFVTCLTHICCLSCRVSRRLTMQHRFAFELPDGFKLKG
jgi:hypothetical protein